jgi:hypothetical protein
MRKKKDKVIIDKKADSQQWNFPKQTLEDSIGIPRAIEEKYAGKPVNAEDLVKIVGFKRADDWRFRDLLRSANLYGLAEGSGAKSIVKITQTGTDIVSPDSPAQRQQALLKAFKNVDLFNKVAEHYEGKKIPEDEYFGNTLTKQFGIDRDRIDAFIDTFQKNLQFLKAFAADKEGNKIVGAGDKIIKKEIPPTEQQDKQQIREFLDTCFIVMPFGEWFDKYYAEIYVPATKEAGFEPVRADGLFNTGSVMEQIWDQIKRAKVLLAELTDKNANVFYELGLSHAISKPVIFVTGNLDDVPFDLRHLRVICYDIREPNWGDKLRKSITLYLKNTKADPDKSIPQPFRKQKITDSKNADETTA